jgi:hypothetical protein
MPASGPKPRRIQWWFRPAPDGQGTRVVHKGRGQCIVNGARGALLAASVELALR